MTPTSATCRASKPVTWATPVRGFTLLELVVVLALLALATALVAPSGFRMIASWQRATEVDASLQAVAALGSGAAQAGRAGWQVELDAPLAIQANGACSDSHGRVRGPDGHEQPFQVLAPFCRTRRSGDAP